MTVLDRGRLPRWVLEVPLAHRGLHGDGVPENSLAAFAAARDAGVGVELDVHATADGVPVVVHDADLRRAAGVDLDVRTVPLAAVREHRIADGTVVPTLVEVLDVLGDAPVMVELKNLERGWGTLEPAVAEVLDEHGRRAYVASFHPGSLWWFRRHRPRVLRAQTAERPPASWLPAAASGAIGSLVTAGSSLPHLLSYDVAGLGHDVVRRWRSRGGAVIAWTVRDAASLATARASADNVIFDTIPPPVG